jgi:thiol-disulfide isomerase/thioredoxin
MVRLKYEPEKNVKNLTGPCVIVIHAEWCGHCKDFMPVYNNEIVKSNNFDEELKDLLTLSSVEEKEYSNAKDLFGEIDGYPTIRYITFDEDGKPLKDNNNNDNNNNGTIMKIDAVNIPRNSEAVTNWINSVVKSDIKKKHKHRHKNKHGMRGGGGSKKAKRVVKRTRKSSKKTKKSKRVKRT